ncbi:MAG TPA: ABC transporter permease [Acidobacteriaceae bacterium]|jgi:predicted permease|nr:ABC transporter permease [Acidobacteriaceae bacterium]
MTNVLQDLSYALRQLRKSWAFALVVILTLAMGVGANTAVFSVMNAILLQLLPVSRPEGLSYVQMANGQGQAPGGSNTGDSATSFTEETFEALRQRTDVFEELIAYVPLSFTGSVAVRYGQLPEESEGEEVSGNFFSGVGVRMALGRGFSLNDEKSHAAIVVLSYDYWTRRFSREPGVLGQTLYVRGVPLTIVGITAKGFKGIEPGGSADFWIPLQQDTRLNAWGADYQETLYGTSNWWCLRMMARLRPGINSTQAQQALAGTFGDVVTKRLGKIDPKQWKPLLEFIPARGVAGYSDQYREPVYILMGLVVLVLLIACTNVAMMVQARNTVRQREFSLRLAMGAGRARIFRQLLIESLVLVTMGAGLGWFFALSATRALTAWSGIESGLSPDGTVLLFTLLVSVTAALLFGLVPLWSAVNAPVAGVLRSTATNTTANRSRVLGGRVVLAVQMAVCLVLLMAGGLLLRTLKNYASQNLGIQTEGLLVFGVTPQNQADDHIFYRDLLDRLRSTPGVESAAMVENRPGSGWSNNNYVILDGVEHRDAPLRSNGVGAGFFRTMGVPVLQGREILESDVQNSQLVAVVNKTLADRFYPYSSPIGHLIGGGKHPQTIVGVVADSKYTSVSEKPQPMSYPASMQSPSLGLMHIEVRTRGEALPMLPMLRKVVAQAYPNVPLQQPMTQGEQFEKSYERQRMFAAMGGFFGVLAAVLVATGLYGTHSFRVSRRTTEIGVRMALGATRMQVLSMVMRESLWILVAGLVLGVPLTYFAIRPLKSMLYQMSPFDPVSFAVAIAAMTMVALSAALLPARRASRLEPMQALRTE